MAPPRSHAVWILLGVSIAMGGCVFPGSGEPGWEVHAGIGPEDMRAVAETRGFDLDETVSLAVPEQRVTAGFGGVLPADHTMVLVVYGPANTTSRIGVSGDDMQPMSSDCTIDNRSSDRGAEEMPWGSLTFEASTDSCLFVLRTHHTIEDTRGNVLVWSTRIPPGPHIVDRDVRLVASQQAGDLDATQDPGTGR